MNPESTIKPSINPIYKHPESQFHDAVDEFPFIDTQTTFDDEPDDDVITSVISPSYSGLRRRRRKNPDTKHPDGKNPDAKNPDAKNPDGKNPDGKNPGGKNPGGKNPDGKKSLNPSLNRKPNKKVQDFNSRSENNAISTVTSVTSVASVANDERSGADSAESRPSVLHLLIEFLFKVIGYQANNLVSSVTLPLRLLHTCYLLFIDPLGVFKLGRNLLFGNVASVWGICYSGVKLVYYVWFEKHDSTWKWCCRIGKVLLWMCYCGVVTVGLLVPAFVVSGMVVRLVVEEPVRVTEELNFDYTRESPVAFVPIVSCAGLGAVGPSGKSEIKGFGGTRGIPFGHELQATVSLTLPESDYNRNLGIFEVRVDFLSSDGKALASTRQPCMLQFKSQPIRLVSTFFKLASILTGYSSETQTLDIKFKGYTEEYVPTSCSRVVIEQRAEFARGGGVPEIYSASLKLESQLPFLKRMLWYWKVLIYVWISSMIFLVELLFTLLCCIPIIFPGVRRGGSSSTNSVSRNTVPGRS